MNLSGFFIGCTFQQRLKLIPLNIILQRENQIAWLNGILRGSGGELRETIVVDGLGIQEIGSAKFIFEFTVFLLVNEACT